MSAVNKLVELVKPTYGPAENKVIIGKGYGASALDDGVQIAKDLELENEAENYVLKLIREVAVKTNEMVGDGTTSSLIMLQAIMKEALGKDRKRTVNELKQGLREAVEQLKAKSEPIKTREDLEKVALVSFNDKEIAKLLSDLIYQIGENGLIDVQLSQGASIESEVIGGFKIDSGYASLYMVSSGNKSVTEDAVILATDKSFLNNLDVLPVMEKVLEMGKNNLVVFCKDFGGEALATTVLNRRSGKFNLCAIKSSEQDIKDIALITGANHVLLENKINIADFGFAKRVVAEADNTKIIGGNGKKEKLDEVVNELKKDEKNNKRIANLTNSVAVIKVGAKTENEAKALQFKIEDASNAVRVAFRGGVVAGAGQTLASLNTSCSALNKALKYPKKQLEKNLGLKRSLWQRLCGQGGFIFSDDIIDPTEVLIAGIECAISIACLLITTTSIIYDTKKQ